jgi:hypothetical protein
MCTGVQMKMLQQTNKQTNKCACDATRTTAHDTSVPPAKKTKNKKNACDCDAHESPRSKRDTSAEAKNK